MNVNQVSEKKPLSILGKSIVLVSSVLIEFASSNFRVSLECAIKKHPAPQIGRQTWNRSLKTGSDEAQTGRFKIQGVARNILFVPFAFHGGSSKQLSYQVSLDCRAM